MNPQVVFILGGPGSGKSTHCRKIQQKYGFHHISAGDCLREEASRPDSPHTELINECIKEGKIVPVDITCQLLRAKMDQLGWHNLKVLIDGFPRNQDNLDGWNRAVKDVDVLFCLHIHCPDDVLINRLLLRGNDSNRSDDNKETIKKRLEIYTRETLPITEMFRAQNLYHEIDGNQLLDNVWNDIQPLFESLK